MTNMFERPRNQFEETPQQPEEKPSEDIKLRFPEIYQSPEWQSLEETDRAQLILVAEGVKPGTIISGDFTKFQEIIKKMGLVSRRNTEETDLEPVFEVASPEAMSTYYKELVVLPEHAPDEEMNRIEGKFLGYPDCCTEEYINPKKNKQEMINKYGAKKAEKMWNLKYEVEQMIEKTGAYPEELDYRPPSFTPCSATCPDALKILGQWKQVIEQADPQAAQGLKEFNWQDEPYRRIHSEEDIYQRRDSRDRDDQLKELRRKAGL